MSIVQILVLALLAGAVGVVHIAARRARRAVALFEQRASTPVGGLLDESVFAWVLDSERTQARLTGLRLTLLLVHPVDRRWDRRMMARIARRNELAIAVGRGGAAVLLWHRGIDDLHLAIGRIAKAVEASHALTDIGWTSADADDVDAATLIDRARKSRCSVVDVGDLLARGDAQATDQGR